MSNNNVLQPGAHILLYPMSGSGHMIPALDLAHLLLSRGLTVTFLISHADLQYLDPILSLHTSTLHTLVLTPPDFPPSSHPIVARLLAAKQLRDPIVDWFRSHSSPPVAVVADFFLGWIHEVAAELGIPSAMFSPSGAFASLIFHTTWENIDLLKNDIVSYPDIPNCPTFPLRQVSHLPRIYVEGDPNWDVVRDSMLANMKCWGLIYNTFEELEGIYIDALKKKLGHHRVWAVGPLLPKDDGPISKSERGGANAVPAHEVLTWLDNKGTDSVVYICFGSRATLSEKQMGALTAALERSTVHFILCAKASDSVFIPEGFEESVGQRGFVVRGWAPQVAILGHRAVGAFVTHCGWNSTMEGLTAGVMMLMWPMMADQFSNAMLVVDQLAAGVRLCGGGPEVVPDVDELCRLLNESVNRGRKERVRAVELSNVAVEAVSGGSSSKDVDRLVEAFSCL